MKMNLSTVFIEAVHISDSRKNSGGVFAKMKLTATMTKSVRKVMGVGNDGEEWPPQGEKAGKLKGSFDASSIILTRKQPELLESLNEADIKISLADNFTWRLEDAKDESNKTVLYTFWARSSELEAVQLMAAYKFAVQGGESAGVMTYTKPGDGTRAEAYESQLPLTDESREAANETQEGKAPTHAEKLKQRKEESERKAAARKSATVQ